MMAKLSLLPLSLSLLACASPIDLHPDTQGEKSDEIALSMVEVGICMSSARTCAFKRLDEGAPTSAQAIALIQECLAEEDSCTGACEVPSADYSPTQYCGELAEALVFYGGQDQDCRETFSFCMDDCTFLEENSPFLDFDDDEFEFNMSGEAICWVNESNESCDEITSSVVATPILK